ncbi:hypothetical protein EDB85DRAFT_1888158 [Lactarius pseudohatsudake]|nr:hypothetical protein EDB85DRAFT_1888158 [Lactarius pseudohatsudake]
MHVSKCHHPTGLTDLTSWGRSSPKAPDFGVFGRAVVAGRAGAVIWKCYLQEPEGARPTLLQNICNTLDLKCGDAGPGGAGSVASLEVTQASGVPVRDDDLFVPSADFRPHPTALTRRLETTGRCSYPPPPPLPFVNLRPPLGVVNPGLYKSGKRNTGPHPTALTRRLETTGRCSYPPPPPLPFVNLRPPLGVVNPGLYESGKRNTGPHPTVLNCRLETGRCSYPPPPPLPFVNLRPPLGVSRAQEPLAPARAFAGSLSLWTVLPPSMGKPLILATFREEEHGTSSDSPHLQARDHGAMLPPSGGRLRMCTLYGAGLEDCVLFFLLPGMTLDSPPLGVSCVREPLAPARWTDEALSILRTIWTTGYKPGPADEPPRPVPVSAPVVTGPRIQSIESTSASWHQVGQGSDALEDALPLPREMDPIGCWLKQRKAGEAIANASPHMISRDLIVFIAMVLGMVKETTRAYLGKDTVTPPPRTHTHFDFFIAMAVIIVWNGFYSAKKTRRTFMEWRVRAHFVRMMLLEWNATLAFMKLARRTRRGKMGWARCRRLLYGRRRPCNHPSLAFVPQKRLTKSREAWNKVTVFSAASLARYRRRRDWDRAARVGRVPWLRQRHPRRCRPPHANPPGANLAVAPTRHSGPHHHQLAATPPQHGAQNGANAPRKSPTVGPSLAARMRRASPIADND